MSSPDTADDALSSLQRVDDDKADLEDAIKLLAETSTSDETPGVYADEILDTLVYFARKWVRLTERQPVIADQRGES